VPTDSFGHRAEPGEAGNETQAGLDRKRRARHTPSDARGLGVSAGQIPPRAGRCLTWPTSVKAVAIAAIAVAAGGVGLLLTAHSRAPLEHHPTGAASPQNSTCADVSFAAGAGFRLVFNESVSCYQGLAAWGVNISFAWVAQGGEATLFVDWACAGFVGCLVEATPPVYNSTGIVGASSFNTTTTGPEWEGQDLGVAFWVGPANAYASNLPSGESVNLIVVVR
jgi:hypothetical protein